MCVIIIKQQQDMQIPAQTLEKSAQVNPHGLGVVWLDTFDVSYHKSSEWRLLNSKRPFIAHFRFATIGAVNQSNTHPFVCGDNADELLMMNGTIHGLGDDRQCDSKVLANMLGKVNRRHWKKGLAKYDKVRFCTINTATRSFQIYNKDLWTKRDGVWFSKDNVLEDNYVAVYGTLKRGHGNYNRFLRDSTFVGSGTTAEKYPLIISGLPYVVERKGVGYNVEVDVFKVSDTKLAELDSLEGHPHWYIRKQVFIKVKGSLRMCWLYFNPTVETRGQELHKSYGTCTIHTQMHEDTYPESTKSETIDAPMCEGCYNDLEFHPDVMDDGTGAYYCEECCEWYSYEDVRNQMYLS